MKPKFQSRHKLSRLFVGSCPRGVAAVTGAFLLSSGLHAKTITWDGGYPTTGVWNNIGNWDDQNFANGDDVVIGPLCKGNYIGTDRTVNSMTYTAACDASFNTALNSSGNPASGNMRKLTWQSGNSGITIEAGNGFANTLGNVNNGAGAEIVLAGDLTVTHNGDFPYTIVGVTVGASGIERAGTGAGVMRLSAPGNTYAGNTTVTQGILELGNSEVIPDGASKGDVSVASLGTLDVKGQTETINGLSGSGTVDNSEVVPASLSVGSFNQSSTFDGIFTDSGLDVLNLTKIGLGTLTLSGASTHEGSTLIEAGKLVGVTGGSTVSSTVTINSVDATFGVSVTDNTMTWTSAGLAVAAAGGLEFGFGAVAPSTSVAPLTVTNAADFTATPTVNVTGSNLPVAGFPVTIPLMTWGSTSGTAPTAVSLPAGYTGSLGVNGNTLELTLTSFTVALAKANNTDNLNLASSWTTGAVPLSTEVAPWDSTVTGPNTTLLGADTTWAGIKILDPGGLVTIDAGNTLTIGAATTDIDMASATVDLMLNCDLIAGADNEWDVGPGRDLALNGTVSGSSPITKAGGGSVTLAGFNAFSGGLTLDAGILNLGSDGALGDSASTLTIQGGSIDNSAGFPLFLTSDNPQAWDADFTYIGSEELVMGAGAVTLGADRTVTVNASRLTVGGSVGGSGTLTKAGAGGLRLSGANTFSGDINVDAGTLSLAGNNTFSGLINVNQGRLNVEDPGALGSGVLVIANSGAVLGNESGGPVVVSTVNELDLNTDFTFAGPNDLDLGTGPVYPVGTRKLTVNNSRLTIGGVIAGGAVGLTKSGNSGLELTGANEFSGGVVITGGGNSTIFANTIENAGVASSLGTGDTDPVIQIGGGENSGVLAYTGAAAASTDRQIRIGLNGSGSAGGSVVNNNADPAHTLTFTNPVFNLAATGTPFGRSFTLGGSNTGDNTVQGDFVTNTLNGAGDGGHINFTKGGSGTWVLAGNNSYVGNTSINGGILKLGSGTVIPDGPAYGNLAVNATLDMNGFSETVNGLSGGGTIDTVSGGTPTLTVGGNDQTSDFFGTIQNTLGTLSLTKIGAGTLILSGTNTYSGDTTVSAGVLQVNGASIDDGGRLLIKSGAQLNVTNYETVDTLYFGTTPQPAGKYGSTVAASFETPGTVTIDDVHFTGDFVLTVTNTGPAIATPYDNWVALYPGLVDTLPGDDQDNDSLLNQDEFAYGLDPTSGSSVNPIVVGLDSATGNFSFSWNANSGLTYTIWSSTDLVTWTARPGAILTPVGAPDGFGTQTVDVTNLGATAVDGRLFVRVTAD